MLLCEKCHIKRPKTSNTYSAMKVILQSVNFVLDSKILAKILVYIWVICFVPGNSMII